MKPLLLLTATILFLSTGPAFGNNRVVRVAFENQDQIRWLQQMGGSVEQVDPEGRFFDLNIPAALEEELIEQEIPYDVLIEDVAAYAKEAMAAPVSSSPTQDQTLDHYLTYDEMKAFLFDLEQAYPDILSVTEAGQSTLGKTLYLIKISDNVAEDENEPELFFEGQIHGDEIAGYTLILHMIQYLTENYLVDSNVAALVKDREIFFLPATNADGSFAQHRIRYNANGVDCNRDNGYMWHGDGGSGAPFGEQETRNLFAVWHANQFVFHSSFHAGEQSFSLPWSYKWELPMDWDEHDYLGEGYCAVNDMIDQWFAGSRGMYQMQGSTKDFAYGALGAMSWTVELTTVKQCSWQVSEEMMEANRPSILWLLEQAGNGLSGIITDSQTGQPVPAVIDIDGKQVAYSDPDVGDFHRFLLPGAYDLTVWANGYAPAYLEGVVVEDTGSTDVSLSLDPDPAFGAWATAWLYNFSGNDRVSHQQTKFALGPPDGQFVSLGSSEVKLFDTFQAHVVLDFGPRGIEDRQGDDLYLYEGNDDGRETLLVYGAAEPFPADWTLIGAGQGDCSFDLGQAGLESIRYVKLENPDPPKWFWQMREEDGYDLDAIGIPSIPADDDDDDDDDQAGNDDDAADDDDSGETEGPILTEEDDDDSGCCG